MLRIPKYKCIDYQRCVLTFGSFKHALFAFDFENFLSFSIFFVFVLVQYPFSVLESVLKRIRPLQEIKIVSSFTYCTLIYSLFQINYLRVIYNISRFVTGASQQQLFGIFWGKSDGGSKTKNVRIFHYFQF